MKPLLIEETVVMTIDGNPKIYGVSYSGKSKDGMICKFYHEQVSLRGQSPEIYKTETIVQLFFPDKTIITALTITEPIKNIDVKDCLITIYKGFKSEEENELADIYILKIKDKYFGLSHETAKNCISAGIKVHTYP